VWRSWLARRVWDAEVGGSSPLTPTTIFLMMYKAIIFDLDGTAIPYAQDADPSPRLIQAIRAAEETMKICAATGRPISNAKRILDKLGLTDPSVISAGTEIIDPQSAKVMWECDIEPEDVDAIVEICKPYPYELLMRNELIGEGKPAAEHQHQGPINVVYLMQCSSNDAEDILEKLLQVPNISASGVISWAGSNVDIHITHKEATKEHAIAKLLEIIGVTRERVIGIGDANNDVHLFKAVGLKVAMGNGTELLKSQADVVCDTVDNDGLAKFIEEIIQQQASLKG
jgi:hydroxymethylpyrimidine pyrophosphatase-like HAD family hydrolase